MLNEADNQRSDLLPSQSGMSSKGNATADRVTGIKKPTGRELREQRLTAKTLPNPEKEPSDSATKFALVKDLYGTLVSTRQLEIGLFWQRSNYFLVLNTGLALGFFKEVTYAPIFAVMGILSSALWFWVCLGGKYWQTRWEQRLMDFEADNVKGLNFFSANPDRIDLDVARGLRFREAGGLKQWIYKKALLQHPSVSFSMMLLAIVFFAGWVAVGLVYLGTVSETK